MYSWHHQLQVVGGGVSGVCACAGYFFDLHHRFGFLASVVEMQLQVQQARQGGRAVGSDRPAADQRLGLATTLE